MQIGMVIWFTETDDYKQVLPLNFKDFRFSLDWNQKQWVINSKTYMLNAMADGARFVWGILNGGRMTDKTWKLFREEVLKEAQWAQDNGIYEFQIGNEEEYRSDIPIPTLVSNLKSLATEVKQIYAIGNISYSPAYTFFDEWFKQGKGDIDLIGGDIYRDNEWFDGDWFSDAWKKETDNLIKAFGVDGMYISEFNISASNVNLWSTDQESQTKATQEMIDYFESVGVKRAYFYRWKDYPNEGNMGVIDVNGDYRYVWNILNTKENIGVRELRGIGDVKIITKDGVERDLNTLTITETDVGAKYSIDPYFDVYYHKYIDNTKVNPNRQAVLLLKKGAKPEPEWWNPEIPDWVKKEFPGEL